MSHLKGPLGQLGSKATVKRELKKCLSVNAHTFLAHCYQARDQWSLTSGHSSTSLHISRIHIILNFALTLHM